MPAAAYDKQNRGRFHGLWVLAAVLLTVLAAQTPAAAQQAQPSINTEATGQLFNGVFANDLAVVQAAIAAGGDLGVRNDWGLTAIDLAVDKGYYGIAHYLLDVRNFRRQQTQDAGETRPLAEPLSTRQQAEAPFEPGKARAAPASGVLSGPLPTIESASDKGPEAVRSPPLKGPNPFDAGTVTKGAPAITGQIQGPSLPAESRQAVPAGVQRPLQPSVVMPSPPASRQTTEPVAETKKVPPTPAATRPSPTSAAPPSPPQAPVPAQSKPPIPAPSLSAPEAIVRTPAVAEVASAPRPPLGEASPPAPKVVAEPLASPPAPTPAPKMASTMDTGTTATKPMVKEAVQPPASPPPVPAVAPKAPPVVAPDVAAVPSRVQPKEVESPSVLGGIFDRMAGWIPESPFSSDPKSASSEPVPTVAAADAPKAEPQISALPIVEPPEAKPLVSPQPLASALPALKASLGSDMPLGRPYREAIAKSCVKKQQGQVSFCVEPVSWPENVEAAFNVSTVMYQGRQAIVRYDGGASTASHALFEQEAYGKISAWARERFGAPTSEQTERITVPGKPAVDNMILLWRGIDPDTGLVTTLEIRSIDNIRTGFPDRRYGMVRLFREGGETVFPQLSTMDLMLMR